MMNLVKTVFMVAVVFMLVQIAILLQTLVEQNSKKVNVLQQVEAEYVIIGKDNTWDVKVKERKNE
jgi:hypothetical protein